MRNLLILICSVLLSVSFEVKASAFAKGEQDCSKCHTLSEEQAKKVIGEVIPNVKILSVKSGPFQGIWEVGFEANGQKSIIYVDYSLNFILAKANIISLKDKKNVTEESLLKISRVDLTGFPYQNALVLGDSSAKNRVIVFDDPD